MKKLFLVILSIAVGSYVYGQAATGFEIPPNSTTSYNWCAPNANILVFYDEFNGDTLSPIWLTFGSWKGMAIEDDNWPQSRAEPGYTPITSKTIFLDKNVNLSEGNLILSTYREPTYWICDTCVSSPYFFAPFTSGMIALSYRISA